MNCVPKQKDNQRNQFGSSALLGVFAWCRLCPKAANPLRRNRKMQKNVNPLEQMFGSASPCAYLAWPCPIVRTLCESAPKVRTLSRFRKARAQKCEPFASLRQKCEPFPSFAKHVPKSLNHLKVLSRICTKVQTLSIICKRVAKGENPLQIYFKTANP